MSLKRESRMGKQKERFPFLKKMTSLTEKGNTTIDQTNLVYSFEFIDNYKVFYEFLTWFIELTGIDINDIEIGEGFKSLEIHQNEEPLSPYDVDSHEFRNLIFKVDSFESKDLHKWFKKKLVDFEFANKVVSLSFDKDIDYFILKLNRVEEVKQPMLNVKGE
jgi:hypothetical protein